METLLARTDAALATATAVPGHWRILTGVAVGLASGSAVPVDRRPLAELAFADRFGRALELAALR